MKRLLVAAAAALLMRVMMALAHSVTVMQNGAVIAEGTPAEIQRNRAVIDAYLGEEEAVDAAA